MKITFEHPDSPKIGNHKSEKLNEVRKNGEIRSASIVYQQNGIGGNENWISGMGMPYEKGKSLTELQQEAASTDVAIQQDYRTVLSHTMSEEDYARMEEEGFQFARMDPETAVTIVDKIKAELARSGQHIAGYTDDLDMNTLAAALGSDTLAAAVRDSFQEADIPLTKENLDGVKMAWDMASSLSEPGEAGYRYMVDNHMEPEVWNFYLAQSSGAVQAKGAGHSAMPGTPRFYAEDIGGYYAESADGRMDAQMQDEIDKLLAREELPLNEENRQAAEKLFADGLPLTRENLALLKELESVSFPVAEDAFARAAASAIVSGKAPIYANLAETGNIYDKAVRMLAYWNGKTETGIPSMEKEILPTEEGILSAEMGVPVEDITFRRQLEEVRLRMSAEVNVKLIRSGFAIDTAPMEQFLEALRRAEAEVAEKYFPADTEAVPKYELYRNVNTVMAELPGLPVQILGEWSTDNRSDSLFAFHAAGKALQETYERAQQSYEMLMTVPRKDLGDSIKKAFTNVDDILGDLLQEANEENRRAVRILGYNRMTVDVENIVRIREIDAHVQSVINKMTPSSVLKLIRDGINPLEQSFEKLEQYLDSERNSPGFEEEAESYSRFLYGLEQNKEITQDERDAFIGIYRMLHQIEKSDGAVVGALVNAGAEIHFANLLSAVRSGKFKSMDVSVTENFGATVEVIHRGESISEQIARGFVDNARQILTKVSQNEETETSYRKAELEQIRQAASVDAESVELLIRGEMPQNAENLLAAQALLNPSSNPFSWKLRKDLQTLKDSKDVRIEELLEHMDGREEFQEEFEKVVGAMVCEVQQDSIQEADNSVDVRSLKLVQKQLSLAAGLSQQEDYIFPMYIGEALAKVRLTLDRAGGEKGRIDIAVDLPGDVHLEGHFQAMDGRISGFLVGNSEDAVMKLQKAADIFSSSVQEGTEGDWKVDKLPVTDRRRTADLHHRAAFVNREVPDGEEAYTEVNNTELYRIARIFLKAVQK